MKIKESFWNEAAKMESDADRKLTRTALNKSNTSQAETAGKLTDTGALPNDESKFLNILESSAKLQKPDQKNEESSEDRREDQKKDDKKNLNELRTARNLQDSDRTEEHGSYVGQSGFSGNSSISGPLLNDNFAARSILHIADLERMVSTIRLQTNSEGGREVVLRLKHSVMEGLQVKILTDPAARVEVQFLAANETMRTRIAENSAELTAILQGRGINLAEIKTSVQADAGGDPNDRSSSFDVESLPRIKRSQAVAVDELPRKGESAEPLEADGKFYKA